jgi:hypothetical protein
VGRGHWPRQIREAEHHPRNQHGLANKVGTKTALDPCIRQPSVNMANSQAKLVLKIEWNKSK